MGTTSSRRDYLRAKYGWSLDPGGPRSTRTWNRRAAADGLEYHLTADGLTGNTFDAHRLVHLAGDRGRQDEAVERFFRAYFTEQRSLFDKASLETLAVDAGLDADEALPRRWPAATTRTQSTPTSAKPTRWASRECRSSSSIDALGLSGAQPVEIFVDAIRQAEELK